MLAESVLLYNLIYQSVLQLSGPYKDAIIREENEENGVYECKTMVPKAAPIAVCNSTDFMLVDFNTKHDPVGVILGMNKVFLTVREIHFLTAVEESKRWDAGDAASVLRHIKDSQLVREILFQTGSASTT